MQIEPCASAEQPGWLRLRQALWPEAGRDEHLLEMASFVADARRYGQFLAYSPSHEAIGLAEVSLRGDHAFLDGLYVVPQARRKGVATALVAAACEWARQAGCREIASDAVLENSISHVVHRALGFEETERVVFFRRKLA